jgi:4-amino-4-deoxy-L-arabinose transferase-like glycosyltransferase
MRAVKIVCAARRLPFMSLETQDLNAGRIFALRQPRLFAQEAVWNPTHAAWQPIVILLLLSGALFFYGLNLTELYRTEALRAIIGAEMLRSGDWIVPRLYGEPLVTKPPGMYAAIAILSAPFGGVTEWTARLPSALAATAIVLLMFWYVGRQIGRLGGLVVAAVTPCGFLWIDKAGSAEIDMLQVGWTAAALLFFFRAVEEHDQPGGVRRFGWWLAALLCVAGGVLTKWTGPMFFYATAIPFLLWRKQFRLLFSWQHLLSALIGAGLCFAWAGAAIQQIGWERFAETISQEVGPRVSYEQHLDANSPWQALAHPFRLLFVNLPWSGFALLTLWPGFMRLWDERGRRMLQAFHCWAWPSLLLFTFFPDHATRHSFPLFPGIVGLGGMCWLAFLEGRLPERLAAWHSRFSLLALGGFGLIVLAGAVGTLFALPSSVWWLALIAVLMGLWCVREGLRAYRARRFGWLLGVFVLTWVVCKFGYLQLYLPVRHMNREPRARAALLARHVPPSDTLYLFRMKDEGIMFYYGRPVRRLKGFHDLPHTTEPVYCVVMEEEWREWKDRADWQVVLEVHLKDEQNDPMLLVGLQRGQPEPQHAVQPEAPVRVSLKNERTPCLLMPRSCLPASKF